MKITYNTDRFPLVKVFFNDDPDPKNKYYDDFMKHNKDVSFQEIINELEMKSHEIFVISGSNSMNICDVQ